MKRNRMLLIIVLGILLLIVPLLACQLPFTSRNGSPTTAPVTSSGLETGPAAAQAVPAVVPGQVIIKFVPEVISELPTNRQESATGALSVRSAAVDPILAELEITSLEPLLAEVADSTGQSIGALSDGSQNTNQVFVAQFDPERDSNEVAAAIASKAQVLFAEPDYVAFATSGPAQAGVIPNDPYFEYQWNMRAIQMIEAWQISTGAGVTVAVLDTGIAQNAPDLVGVNFASGYNFISNNTDATDNHGHGTHVAGTVAQATNNGVGVTGVAPGATLMPVKVLDRRGQGSYSGIIQGMAYAVENGADIINMSLAGSSPSQALKEAIDAARAQGVIVIVAAGNVNGPVQYPARYPNTIAVGAVRYDELRAPYSNFGPEINLVAPGGDNKADQNEDGFGDGIVQQSFKQEEGNNTFRYLFFEGTSMAAPHVAGAAALLLSENPDLTQEQVLNLLQSTAKDLGFPGRDNEYGYGLIQVYDALVALQGPPPSPTPAPATPTPTLQPGVTPSPTPIPPTATPVPPGQTSGVIINGDFEGPAGWVFQPDPNPAGFNSTIKRSGNRSAALGVWPNRANLYGYSSIVQNITVPSNARQATLSAHLYLQPADTYAQGDRYFILLENQRLLDVPKSNDLTSVGAWREYRFDVTRYAGQTIQLYFGTFNDGRNLPALMYVDDVRLEVTQ